MRSFVKVVAAATALFALGQTSAHAQATRTWVSGVGDDANPCSRTAPCKTFPGAISKTAMNGEINCLDPGGFGTVTIIKSITIDCHEVFASILASGTQGIIINITNASDSLKTVRIRNINISGAGSNARSGIRGINIIAANAVFIEDSMIRDFTQQGILDARITGGELYINNTTVQDNAGAGLIVAPSSGAVRIDAAIANSIFERNAFGVRASSGVRMAVKKSVMSGNTTGALSDGPAGASSLTIDDSLITNNGTGVLRQAGGSVFLSNSDISQNTTGKTGAAGLFSFGNNRVTRNGADGDAFTPVSQQ
jgi:hypothetical protein